MKKYLRALAILALVFSFLFSTARVPASNSSDYFDPYGVSTYDDNLNFPEVAQ